MESLVCYCAFLFRYEHLRVFNVCKPNLVNVWWIWDHLGSRKARTGIDRQRRLRTSKCIIDKRLRKRAWEIEKRIRTSKLIIQRRLRTSKCIIDKRLRKQAWEIEKRLRTSKLIIEKRLRTRKCKIEKRLRKRALGINRIKTLHKLFYRCFSLDIFHLELFAHWSKIQRSRE